LVRLGSSKTSSEVSHVGKGGVTVTSLKCSNTKLHKANAQRFTKKIHCVNPKHLIKKHVILKNPFAMERRPVLEGRSTRYKSNSIVSPTPNDLPLVSSFGFSLSAVGVSRSVSGFESSASTSSSLFSPSLFDWPPKRSCCSALTFWLGWLFCW